MLVVSPVLMLNLTLLEADSSSHNSVLALTMQFVTGTIFSEKQSWLIFFVVILIMKLSVCIFLNIYSKKLVNI